MTRIFISYRRDDSRNMTDRIHDHLAKKFGKDNVFLDVVDMPLGVHFPSELMKVLNQCDIVLVIIGAQWINVRKDGRRRLDDPDDFVRLEVEKALSSGKFVIPITVDGANMPNANELPVSIKQLAYINGQPIGSNPNFDGDIERLIKKLPTFSNLPRIHNNILPHPFDWRYITNENKYFAIAKYPITNQQYGLFIESEDGYKVKKWWSYSRYAMKWRENNTQPTQSRFKGQMRPREMLTWYECMAFCRWLTHRIGENNIEVTLPSAHQRRLALQGTDSRIYPWGNEFDSQLCNTREFQHKTTTSVDQYPDGASPYGVMDLSGNVWEWSVDTHREFKDGDTAKMMYGGGWYSRRRHARADYPRWRFPDYRSEDVGFRICVVDKDHR